ncbi:ATP-binding cassette subfamily B protein [Hydrogenispora ethanolica]|jgi:ATP-binding cassette subfamily B protein|uniref:ATP-binding cassette subfamily B protein n=1 Tax=Hydrogenispora ethanolica TaxID=1082276 RepID=A0A4R1S303_HYDET|nr:ABC transporter ATP-binding protein [Hydrogenispora ethanolica]TCL73294.1 ATP-binding cassette subfamily B protein [Hydrogenispora ethanolica]
MTKELLSNIGIGAKGKGLLGMAILTTALGTLCNAGIMIVILKMMEQITGGRGDLSRYWWALAGITVFRMLFNSISSIVRHFAGFEIVAKIKTQIILRLKQFTLGFYSNERMGEISTVIHNDADNLGGIVGHLGSRMISDFLVAFIIGTGLFLIDWRMGLAMVSLLPAAIWILVRGIQNNLQLKKANQANLADMVSLFVEYTKGIPLLKAFTEIPVFKDRLEASAVKFGESSKKEAKSVASYLGKYFFLFELCYAILATLGAYWVFGNNLSLFDYLIFMIFCREFYRPFAALEGHWLSYMSVKDSYQRVARILDAPVVEKPAAPQEAKHFDIAFDRVGFSYEAGEFELKNASFTLEQGTLTALVGPSGSGKTTITNLMLRFWEPQSGRIQIGDVDIRRMDYDELLANISIVMQNVILFADTIYENIKMGNKNATRAQVMEAARKAMIHDFIMSLPDGYDTPLGENGVGLSGGQKQRLSIARAFLKNAPIVILDEITSNVDPLNEVKIQKAISNLAADRTVLVIAHHLRTIQNADKIIVFNRGEIVEMGKHHQLMQNNGLYRELWDAQERAKEWRICG